MENDEEEDILEYLDKDKAMEFDPTVTDTNTWEAGEVSCQSISIAQ